jgi:hypothetical protein
VPYSPLGRGFLSSGGKLLESLTDSDYRKVFWMVFLIYIFYFYECNFSCLLAIQLSADSIYSMGKVLWLYSLYKVNLDLNFFFNYIHYIKLTWIEVIFLRN